MDPAGGVRGSRWTPGSAAAGGTCTRNGPAGAGPDQAPRQKAPNTGPSESHVVEPIEQVHDGFTYPKTRDVLRVTITPVK